MKTGMNLLLWTGGVTAEHFPLLGKLKAAGFDGVEIPIFGGTPADYKPIRAELDKQGLKCTTVTILTKETNAVSPDAAIAARGRATGSRPSSRSITSSAPRRCAGRTTRRWVCSAAPARRRTRRSGPPTCCARPRSYAKQANLMMAIEYLNRFECYFLNTAAGRGRTREDGESPELPDDVRHASTPTSRRRDQAAAIRTVAPVLAHVHISENDRGTPGTGQVHWDADLQDAEGSEATTAG